MRARTETSAWSLVVFTVCAQAAVGACVMRVACPWIVGVHATQEALDRLTDPLRPVALVLLVVAFFAAGLHLAQPKAARFALSHLGSSWLAREVAFGVLFGAVLVVDVLVGRLGGDGTAVSGGLAWAAALLGLAFVHAIVRVYRLRTVPAWDSWATPAAFFSATLLLGTAALAGVLVLADGPTDLADRGLRGLGLLAVATAGAELLVTWLHLRDLDRQGGVAAESARVVRRKHRRLLALRTLSAAFGALLLLFHTWPGHGTRESGAVLVACGLLLLSELLARTLFYASHRRVGL